MRTIYDYKDIRKLDQSLLSEDLQSGIIVTATSSLATTLRAYYPDYIVVGMHEVIHELIPEWDESTKDLRNYISLRNSMDSYAAETEGDRTLFLSLQRNAADIWNAILLLVEADVYPCDIPEESPAPVRHFKRIWKQLEIENSTLMNLRAQFSFRLSEKANVITGIRSCIKNAYGIEADITEKCLFFLGFYFITPIQARVIDILQKADIKIAYLNCRDKQYTYVGEIWEKTFAEEYLCQSYTDIQPNLSFRNYFGEMLGGNRIGLDAEVTKYASNLEFAQAMREPIRTGASIYTPDLKGCEEILKEYYPELFERKHLLAFPVGQYIYYLHMMWSPIHNRLEMKYEYVYKCFASGWLEDDLVNGRDYLYELSKLETFFMDCTTFEEWRSRFIRLKEAKECINVFEIEDGPNQRWHELLGNPFKQLSVYNLSDNVIDDLEILLSKLMEDAEYLFSSTGKVRISDHFGKITRIINGHLNREDVLDDEVRIAKELVRSLETAGAYDQECPLSAIKDAILLLVGGHFDEVDSLDQEISLIGDRVVPLSKVESSLLSNYGEDIYLVLADEFTLPGRPRDLPWPLSDRLLDSLQIDDREDTKRYVHNMRSVIDNRPLSYRYLFFSYISNVNKENHPKLHISWIKNQGAKTASASPYVLMMWPDVNSLKDTIASIDFEKEINQVAVESPGTDITEPDGNIPEDVLMDYSLCKYRYIYSYLVNYLPEYKSGFHYSFLLSSLIRAFYSESGKNKKEIAKELYELFPFLRNVEQRQASDYSGKGRVAKDPLVYDDAEYPASRLDIHFLQAKDVALRAYEGEKIEDKTDCETRCIYCPYSSTCLFKDEMNGGTSD